jgi:hypothetical protein
VRSHEPEARIGWTLATIQDEIRKSLDESWPIARMSTYTLSAAS